MSGGLEAYNCTGDERKRRLASPDIRESFRCAINRLSRENESNTPDFILAEFLMDVLKAFEIAVNKRTKWYGDHPDEYYFP
jgi:hypothetical protein